MAQENMTSKKKEYRESSAKCKLIGQCFLQSREKSPKLIWSEGIIVAVCLANDSSLRMHVIMAG